MGICPPAPDPASPFDDAGTQVKILVSSKTLDRVVVAPYIGAVSGCLIGET